MPILISTKTLSSIAEAASISANTTSGAGQVESEVVSGPVGLQPVLLCRSFLPAAVAGLMPGIMLQPADVVHILMLVNLDSGASGPNKEHQDGISAAQFVEELLCVQVACKRAAALYRWGRRKMLDRRFNADLGCTGCLASLIDCHIGERVIFCT